MKKKILLYVLIPIGLYALYFVTGAILTATNTVDEWTIAPNTVMASSESRRDKSPAGTDGPHIFYENDKVVVKSVVVRDSIASLVADTFSIEQKPEITVACAFSDNPEWNFTTRLKDTLRNEAAEYAPADSLVAVSDIEGNFAAFRNLLTANKVMSNDYRWIYGTGHLVLLGDFFDRGLHVTECLWLIYHLEQEAEKAGGKVHFILGNHEVMVMGGDVRYVRNKYIENVRLVGVEYKNWFNSGTELGRWLQTKNVVEKIGDLVFTHGGFSGEVNALGMEPARINELCRPHYCTADSTRKHALGEPLKTLYSSKTSPFWYRGYVDEEVSEQEIGKTLSMYNAKAVVVGHTLVDNVTKLYGGRVIAIDTKHAHDVSQGMMYTGGTFYRIDRSGIRAKL